MLCLLSNGGADKNPKRAPLSLKQSDCVFIPWKLPMSIPMLSINERVKNLWKATSFHQHIKFSASGSGVVWVD